MWTNPQLNPLNINDATEHFKQMMDSFQAIRSPQAALGMVLQSNPYYPQAMQLVEEAGGDSMKACRDLCSKMGIDPSQFPFLRGLM